MEGDQHLTLQWRQVLSVPLASPIHPTTVSSPPVPGCGVRPLCLCPQPLIAGYAWLGTIFGAGHGQDADPWSCQHWEGSPAQSNRQKRAGIA